MKATVIKEKGQAMTEYILIVAVIAIGLLAALKFFGVSLTGILTKITATLNLSNVF
ncbi:MAG: Flp family type IVb pilin [Candidatus Firestonebacteria bacterium]